MIKASNKFLDPNLKNKSRIIDESLVTFDNYGPIPSLVEISNSGMCNRKCSFCPRSDPNYNHVNSFIDRKTHDGICDQLKELGFKGILVYSGFNEPLLKKDIYKDIEYAKSKLDLASIQLITNGDVLNTDRLLKLFRSGLTTLLISVYDGEEDYKKFVKMREDNKFSEKEIVIRKRYLSEDKDFGLTLSNRSGNLENSIYKVKSIKKSLERPCNYPSYTFFIDYNGDVLMCSHDWGKKKILGNIKRKTLKEIWYSDISNRVRKSLLSGDRNFSPCNKCDVTGNLIGKIHAEKWLKR